MARAWGRVQRRHVREKATIDHLVRDVYEPKVPDEEGTSRSPTTSTGLPVEDQVRKKWDPRKVGARDDEPPATSPDAPARSHALAQCAP